MICRNVPPSKFAVNPSNRSRARLKSDDTRAETRIGLSAKRTCPVKLAVCQSSRLLAAEVCTSAVVMVVMLDAPCSDTQCKTTGYPLHSHISPSLPLPCVTVCLRFHTHGTPTPSNYCRYAKLENSLTNLKKGMVDILCTILKYNLAFGLVASQTIDVNLPLQENRNSIPVRFDRDGP